MPPITRLQNCSKKTKPYSKENRPSDKRTALFDLNNVQGVTTKSVLKKTNESIFKNDIITKIESGIKATQLKNNDILVGVPTKPQTIPCTKEETRLSLNSSKDSTLYHSAIEKVIDTESSGNLEDLFVSGTSNIQGCTSYENNCSELYLSAVNELSICPNSHEDEIFEIDQTNWNDFMFMGCYAKDIFKYLRQRENIFNVTDYISEQSELTPRHRAIVVDWLIFLQDTCELNHEVLYMAVKLIDLFLMKNDRPKDKFQLLAAGALLLSLKLDQRMLSFPSILVKNSNYIFTEEELFEVEREIVKTLDYDLNVPLSYSFLRRFARCMKCEMILLTLARFILESSLMDYNFVTKRDSLKAAAALYLALKMFSKSVDAKEFLKYTGYNIREIQNTVIELNNMLHTEQPDLSAVKEKYSHRIMYRVAKKSLLNSSKLTFD